MEAELRQLAPSFVVGGLPGVAIRTRLRVAGAEIEVLRAVGAQLGSLASQDLAARCRDGLSHDKGRWAERKRAVTAESSSRWAGAITKSSHDQWALARRNQVAHLKDLDAGIAMIEHRLSQPVGSKGTRKAPGGYRSAAEWHAKSRRLGVLRDRRGKVFADLTSGRVRVVRGGRQLANTRHHLGEAGLTEEQWRLRWESTRMFLSADGETGKQFGNETIRISPDGQVSIKLPVPLAHLANTPHGRYVFATPVTWHHRAPEWTDRVQANRAVAYTISFDTVRSRWYIAACWQPTPIPQLPFAAALATGCVGVDTNADHLAAWRLDVHGNPVGAPKRFNYDLSGRASHRDAQVRHALTQLLHWTKATGASSIIIEDLDFATEKTREKHGRNNKFRQLISRFPTAQLRNRLLSMGAEAAIPIVAVDPAYTSKWGAQHWQRPLSARYETSRHAAAAVVIGRRGQGHSAKRRTSTPLPHQSDAAGPRRRPAEPEDLVHEETRPPGTGTRARHGPPAGTRTRATRPPNTVRGGRTPQDTLLHSG